MTQALLEAVARRLTRTTPWSRRVDAWIGPAGRAVREAFPDEDEQRYAWTRVRRRLRFGWNAQGAALEMGAHHVVENALTAVQSAIWNDDHREWPSRHFRRPRVAIDDLPEAHVSIRDEVIRMWYEDAQGPVLELEPIPLAVDSIT